MVYAGGTDVIPRLKARHISAPEVLVDLKGIPDLDYITYHQGTGLKIGALATIASVAHAPEVRAHYPVLAQAAHSIASTQIRNRGTIAGNISMAVPSADSAPALLCLEAELICISAKGERNIPIHEFFQGPSETILRPDELLQEIRIPDPPEKGRGMYIKLSPRSRMDLAVVGVAVTGVVEEGLFRDVRIGLGAVAPTPLRAREAEDLLAGVEVSDDIIHRAAKQAAEESKPIDDHRGSAQYRQMMVEVLTRRALRQALVH
jgi:carbon-monoxide dehydrogenase medium subunit